jgi:hypothetical protein
MINDLKEETQNLVFDLKEDMNKQLNELKENTNRWMKLRWLSKEEINKDMETLKNNQSKINNSISQIKISIKRWWTEWSKLKVECHEQKTK